MNQIANKQDCTWIGLETPIQVEMLGMFQMFHMFQVFYFKILSVQVSLLYRSNFLVRGLSQE